jgi:hypothetical protein
MVGEASMQATRMLMCAKMAGVRHAPAATIAEGKFKFVI